MKAKIVIFVIVIIAIFVIIKLIIPGEKDLVARDIRSLKNAVEKEDKNGVFKYLDENYEDRNHMTYEQLVNAIDDFFSHADSIKIFMSGIKVWIDSIDSEKNIFASCSLRLKILAHYEGEKTLVFGGVFKPAPVRASFKKSGEHYRLYYAAY